jgi:cation/acetate symporter
MLVYVIFGGMLATTWVQIVKAVLLMTGTILLSVLVLAQFHFSLFEFFDAIARVTGSFCAGGAPAQFRLGEFDKGVALTRFKQNHRTQTLDAVALVR